VTQADWCADMIDKNTHEIRQDEDQTVYKSLDEIAEDLPDHSPRYVLLSYPLTLVCTIEVQRTENTQTNHSLFGAL
jgi:hypothetical protein